MTGKEGIHRGVSREVENWGRGERCVSWKTRRKSRVSRRIMVTSPGQILLSSHRRVGVTI